MAVSKGTNTPAINEPCSPGFRLSLQPSRHHRSLHALCHSLATNGWGDPGFRTSALRMDRLQVFH